MLNGFSSINIYLLSADSLGKITLNRQTAIFSNFESIIYRNKSLQIPNNLNGCNKNHGFDSTYVIFSNGRFSIAMLNHEFFG